jgi:hypothetical protein
LLRQDLLHRTRLHLQSLALGPVQAQHGGPEQPGHEDGDANQQHTQRPPFLPLTTS